MFTSTVRLICQYFITRYSDPTVEPAKRERVIGFVLTEIRLQPRMIRVGLVVLTLLLRLCCCLLPLGTTIERWARSRLHYCRLIIRFYRSLVILYLFDHSDVTPVVALPRRGAKESDKQETTVAVVGSGPGGAITAALLAERGVEVTLIEEGQVASATNAYSCAEMLGQMRWGGLGVIRNRVPISYIEGCCVGGASEINSALYLRAHETVLTQWSEERGLHNCSQEMLRPWYEINEKRLKPRQETASAMGDKLQQGAKSLGWAWESLATLRTNNANALSRKSYTSMSRSVVPTMLEQGGTLLMGRRVKRLKRQPQGWRLEMLDRAGNSTSLYAEQVVLAGGAIQTPRLMQDSGLGNGRVGQGLHSSMVVKVIAEFADTLHQGEPVMDIIQVREFAPEFTLGCAISSKAQIMLGLANYDTDASTRWQNMAIYSLIYTPEARGRVRSNWWGMASEIEYQLSPQDWQALSRGYQLLMKLLFAAGAQRFYPVAERGCVIETPAALADIPAQLDRWSPQLLMLHPGSTCAMSADPAQGVVDSWGRVYGEKRLWINDSSILPGYPGANPQATVMALARQHAQSIIDSVLQKP